MLALILTGCSKNEDEPNNGLNSETEALYKVLKGTFVSEIDISYMNNSKEVEIITFNPYSTPVTEEWLDNLGSKDVIMYGECSVTTYYHFGDTNEKQGEITKYWKYNISASGVQSRLYFYPIGVYGQTQMHNIKIISPSEFEMGNKTFYKK